MSVQWIQLLTGCSRGCSKLYSPLVYNRQAPGQVDSERTQRLRLASIARGPTDFEARHCQLQVAFPGSLRAPRPGASGAWPQETIKDEKGLLHTHKDTYLRIRTLIGEAGREWRVATRDDQG
jgi:hypothetical protein